jgi:2'-5' RNA ligase
VANRHRLGVAVVLDPPVADEVNGLRRAVGDRALARIAPHVTLVPPVNVPARRLGEALARLRAAAAACPEPLQLTLGPPASFLPANPVLTLAVGGDLDRLRGLREAAFIEPLARTLAWPWVPHVTLADDADPVRIDAAVRILDGYQVRVGVDRVVLLEEVRTAAGLRWRPCADAALAPRRVVGRGGTELELTRGRIVDPQALEVLRAVAGPAPLPGPVADGSGIAVTARVGTEAVGVAAAWRDDAGGHVGVAVAPDRRGEGIGSHLLAHVEAAVQDAGWASPTLAAVGPAGFYQARSRWSLA